MKTQSEIVDSRVAIRVIAGLLAVGGIVALPVNLIEDFATGRNFRAIDILKIVGVGYGVFLFGYFALKGKLPMDLGRKA